MISFPNNSNPSESFLGVAPASPPLRPNGPDRSAPVDFGVPGRLQDGPRGTKIRSKRQILPRRLKMLPRRPKRPPRRAQEAPRHRQDTFWVRFGKPSGDKLAPKSHPESTFGENSLKAQNYYFSSTRNFFHVFDLSIILHKIQ